MPGGLADEGEGEEDLEKSHHQQEEGLGGPGQLRSSTGRPGIVGSGMSGLPFRYFFCIFVISCDHGNFVKPSGHTKCQYHIFFCSLYIVSLPHAQDSLSSKGLELVFNNGSEPMQK